MNENSVENGVVHAFPKNSMEEVRFSIREFKGERFIDMRAYFRRSEGDEWLPTRKGLSIRPELLGELEAGLSKLKQAMMNGA